MPKLVEKELVVRMNALHNRIQKRISGALSVHGISFTEYLVLRQLAQATGSKMRRIDLAKEVDLSASGVTRLLNPMEKIGLVVKEKNARDARVSLVAISDAGKRILEESEISFNHAAKSVFKEIDQKNMKLLEGIVDNLL